MKVRSHIALLATVILLPAVVFFAVVLNVLLTAERQAALRSMQELARASVNIMDREMTFAMATAQTLSTSPNLRAGDVAAFYEQASTANQNRGIHAALIRADGQQLFNTVRPYGSAIAAPGDAARDRVKQVIQGGVPVYSGLIRGRATGQFVVSAEFPVALNDGRRVLVNEWMYASHLTTLLPSKGVPPSWLIAVFDQQGMTIARNKHPEKFIGEPPREERLRTILARFEGISRAYTRDGVEMYGAWERSSITGWSVGVGVPVAEIEKAAVQSVALTTAGFLLAVALAAGGAALFSRRLLNAIDAACTAAEALPSYQIPVQRDLHIDEMNRLHTALYEAGAMLVAGQQARQQVLLEAEGARQHAEQAQRLAEQQNKAKDDFLAMLGHELRNPLAAIASGVTVLTLPGIDAERAAKAQAIIGRQTRHLTQLVDDLLDAHRILNGKITLSRTPMDLNSAVEACLASFEARGAMRTHRISTDLAHAPIEADPTRVEQMICNLVDNAVKYTPEGGTIHISVRSEAEWALLTVADSGIGLSPELLDKAFDVFVQGQVVNRSKGGLGLGLAIVHSLAVQLDARLTAHSAGLNQGSVFTLRFPLVRPSGLDAPALAPHALQSPSGRQLLVIEDNQDVREMMQSMLTQQGYSVRVAADGLTGIALARQAAPDVALVDIDLPDMTGYQIAQALRTGPLTAAIRLIAVTGYGQAVDRERALATGFDQHLTKPVPLEALLAAIGAPQEAGNK